MPEDDIQHLAMYGDGINWAACTIIYLLGQRNRFEAFSFTNHTIDIEDASKTRTTEPQLVQFLRNAVYDREINGQIFSILETYLDIPSFNSDLSLAVPSTLTLNYFLQIKAGDGNNESAATPAAAPAPAPAPAPVRRDAGPSTPLNIGAARAPAAPPAPAAPAPPPAPEAPAPEAPELPDDDSEEEEEDQQPPADEADDEEGESEEEDDEPPPALPTRGGYEEEEEDEDQPPPPPRDYDEEEDYEDEEEDDAPPPLPTR